MANKRRSSDLPNTFGAGGVRRADTFWNLIVFGSVICAGLFPTWMVLISDDISAREVLVLPFLSAVGWFALGGVWARSRALRKTSQKLQALVGYRGFSQTPECFLDEYLSLLHKERTVLTFTAFQERVGSPEELAKALQQLCRTAYELLRAESVELGLTTGDAGSFHSSFVLGRPLAAGSADGQGNTGGVKNPRVIQQALIFGGEAIGTLKIGLPQGRSFDDWEQRIVQLLGLQACMAVVNAQFTDEVLRMKQSSQESIRAKTGFLANLSHELRGPLGIMLNASDLLLEELCGPINADQRDTLGMIRSNGAHLLELMNDVLDYAKVELGRVEPQPEVLELSAFMEEMGNMVRTQADAKHHKLTIRKLEAPLSLVCDRRQARQILINLLTNAIKYTPDGGTIELWAERMPGQRVRISIRDSGIGIDIRDRERVFKAFERIDGEYARDQLGTGLGLSLTKKLVELNRGAIDFESHLTQGTTFWVALPVADGSEAHRSAVPALNTRACGELVVFVVEAGAEERLITKYLTSVGFRVTEAGSLRKAEEVTLQLKPHAVVIDESCIPREGWREAVARFVLKVEPYETLLLSSETSMGNVEEMLRLGVSRCMAKPFQLPELAHAVLEVASKADTSQAVT